MAINQDYAPNVLNPHGKVQLITSLELFANVPTADGLSSNQVKIGIAQRMDSSEHRNVTYNYVIGNYNPARARDLIAGPIDNSTLTCNAVALYRLNLIGLLSEDVNNPSASSGGVRYLASIAAQTRPFDIVEKWYNPTTNLVVYQITYTGCMIEQYGSQRQMDSSDIRVMSDVTIHYKDVSVDIGPGANDADLGDPTSVL